MRIVSLLPSATEILFDLGAGDDVVGVTFECDHPVEARQRRIVSTTALPSGLSPSEIDAFVAGAVARGQDLYHLDAGALEDLDPDLVVTQDLCAVCAVDVDTVDGALQHLGCQAAVLTVDPQTLEEVLGSVLTIGGATGRSEAAAAAVAAANERLDAVRRRVAGRPRPRVLVLEWTDPPYSPGHWLPDLVEAAGGVVSLGASGARSSRITWDDVRSAASDLVVVAPCGYDLDAAADLAQQLVDDGLLAADVPVWAADANASWTRPALRLIDAVEDLAAVLHPAEDLPIPRTLKAVHSSTSSASA